MVFYKPGDKIFIYDETRFLRQFYILVQISGDIFLVNLETGVQASAPIIYKNENAITEDEMNATHGIKQFKGRWEYYGFRHWNSY